MTGRFLALGDAPTVIKPGYKPLIRSMPGLDPELPFSGVCYQEGLMGPEDRNHLSALLVSKTSVSALTDEGNNVNGGLRSWLEFSALGQFFVDGEKGSDLVVNYKGNGVLIVPRIVALQVGPLGRVV
jgi:hypothetical protein